MGWVSAPTAIDVITEQQLMFPVSATLNGRITPNESASHTSYSRRRRSRQYQVRVLYDILCRSPTDLSVPFAIKLTRPCRFPDRPLAEDESHPGRSQMEGVSRSPRPQEYCRLQLGDGAEGEGRHVARTRLPVQWRDTPKVHHRRWEVDPEQAPFVRPFFHK